MKLKRVCVRKKAFRAGTHGSLSDLGFRKQGPCGNGGLATKGSHEEPGQDKTEDSIRPGDPTGPQMSPRHLTPTVS